MNSIDTPEEEQPFVPATKMDLDPSSITVFVNKEHELPKDYKPENLVTPKIMFNLITYDERTLMRPEAAQALEQLFAQAKSEGIILYGISAYRSYERQYKIFTNNIVKKGKSHTLRYSAVPGTSEHQTGLAIDVSTKSLGFKLTTRFASSPEGIWLGQNAHKFGYIIRYPKGDEEITGYAYEPWHIRYVGKELAVYLYDNDLTLEEYYNYTPTPGFDFEKRYADLINYTPPIVTVSPEDEEDPDADGELTDDELENDLPEDIIPEDNDTTEEDPPSPDDNTDTPDTEPDDSNEEESNDGNTEEEETDEPITQEPNDEAPEQGTTPTPTPTPTLTPVPTLTPTPTPVTEVTDDITLAALPSVQSIINE